MTASGLELRRFAAGVRFVIDSPLANSPTYSENRFDLSVGNLLVKEESMDYWDLIETAFERVDTYNGANSFLKDFVLLSPPVQHLLAAHWCWSEVNNGGFDQFFQNPTGVLAPEAEVGFRAIGFAEVAQLLVEATARFGIQYPREREERQLAMEALPSDGSRAFDGAGRRFADLDARFYDLLPDPEFVSRSDAYATSHVGR